jgi:hypothetical protein
VTIAELGSIGEFVAALATIATLVYLAIQVRQNNQLGRQNNKLALGAAQRELMTTFQVNLDRVARDPLLFQRGLREFESLSSKDKLAFEMVFNQFINHLEQTLRMHVLDLESQDNVDIYGDICLAFVQEPGGLEVWEKTKSLFFPMSREYVEKRLADRNSLLAGPFILIQSRGSPRSQMDLPSAA